MHVYVCIEHDHPSQADDTSYRPSSPSTINDEDTNNNWTSSLSPSSYDTNTYPSSSNSNTDDDTNPRLTSPSTLNGEPAQSAMPIYRFRSATLRARTIRLANESTNSAQGTDDVVLCDCVAACVRKYGMSNAQTFRHVGLPPILQSTKANR